MAAHPYQLVAFAGSVKQPKSSPFGPVGRRPEGTLAGHGHDPGGDRLPYS